jgi:hypothetical protein
MPEAGKGVGTAIFWAATWGVGVALGVAAGGWLTVVGGSGAPGAESLDVMQDVVYLPAAAGGAVFALHLMGQSLTALVRRHRPGRAQSR